MCSAQVVLGMGTLHIRLATYAQELAVLRKCSQRDMTLCSTGCMCARVHGCGGVLHSVGMLACITARDARTWPTPPHQGGGLAVVSVVGAGLAAVTPRPHMQCWQHRAAGSTGQRQAHGCSFHSTSAAQLQGTRRPLDAISSRPWCTAHWHGDGPSRGRHPGAG
jgi:hypothetical protein